MKFSKTTLIKTTPFRRFDKQRDCCGRILSRIPPYCSDFGILIFLEVGVFLVFHGKKGKTMKKKQGIPWKGKNKEFQKKQGKEDQGNVVVLNAVRRSNTQMSAKERKRTSAKGCKVQKSASA